MEVAVETWVQQRHVTRKVDTGPKLGISVLTEYTTSILDSQDLFRPNSVSLTKYPL